MIGLSLSLGLGIARAGSGGGSVSAAGFAAFDAVIANWDWTAPGNMTAGDGGAVVQGDSDTIALVPNVKTPGTYDIEQTVVGSRPIYDNGAVLDGTDDYLRIPADSAFPASTTMVFLAKTSDTAANRLVLDSASSFGDRLRMFDGDAAGACVSGSAWIVATAISHNGVNVAADNRDALHTALATGIAGPFILPAAAISAWTGIDVGGNGSNTTDSLSGYLMPVGLMDTAQADYADALAYALDEVSRQQTALEL